MILGIIIACAALCIVLFLLGVYTGLYLARNSREVITREVEKIVPTERIVEVPKPVYIQVPVSTPQSPKRPPQGPALAIMGSQPGNTSVITDPNERQQMEHIEGLLNGLPEVNGGMAP